MATKNVPLKNIQIFEVIIVLLLAMALMLKLSSIIAEIVSNNIPQTFLLAILFLGIYFLSKKFKKSKKK